MTFNENARLDTRRMRSGGSGGGGSRGPVMLGGGIGAVVLFLILQFAGVDLGGLGIGGNSGDSGTSEDTSLTQADLSHCKTGADANRYVECRMVGAQNSLDDYWQDALPNLHFAPAKYRSPSVYIFPLGENQSDTANSACGTASLNTGPFYCPGDEGIYIPTRFYEILRTQYGASGGSLAELYVVAHEWGHHVQYVTGIMQQADRRSTGPGSDTVRLELQADCFAGAWAAAATQTYDANGQPFLNPISKAELADALDAAATVGDDHIQQLGSGRIVTEQWTHGSSDNRQFWFTEGYQGGINACDTFDLPASHPGLAWQ